MFSLSPKSETDLVALLLSRNGTKTGVTTVDGEPMTVTQVDIVELPSSWEWDHYAELGGIGMSSDNGRYCFFSNEIDTIKDIASGEVIFTRKKM